MAPAVRFVVAVLAPVTATIQWIVRHTLRLFGAPISDDAEVLSAHEEIRGAIELHHKEGGVVKLTRDMLGGVLDLRELTVSDIMVHRTKHGRDRRRAAGRQDRRRRPEELAYPRCRCGAASARRSSASCTPRRCSRRCATPRAISARSTSWRSPPPPWFVPDTTTLKDQLNAFLKRKAHFAVVVDEYGEVMGLVTLEDIIEEIVGDITDETDIAGALAKPQPDGSLVVDGAVPIRDVNRLMEWDLPDEEATTIAGLVIHEAQTIPNPGQAFTFHDLSLRGAAPPAEPHHLVAGDAASGQGARPRARRARPHSGRERSSGASALMASAWTWPLQLLGQHLVDHAVTLERDLPAKLADTTLMVKWLSPVPGEPAWPGWRSEVVDDFEATTGAKACRNLFVICSSTRIAAGSKSITCAS